MGKVVFFQAKTQALDCRVCLEKLADARVLPCGHSFCGIESSTNCVQKLDHPDGIRCPVCRIKHTVRAADLPKNIALMEVLDESVYIQPPEQCSIHLEPIELYCYSDKTKICVQCLGFFHIGHEVELIGEWRKKRMTKFWNNLNLKEMEEKSRARKTLFKEMTEYLKDECNREHIMAEKCNAIIKREKAIAENFANGPENFVYNEDIRELDSFLNYIYHEEKHYKHVDLDELEKATLEMAKETELF